MVDLNQILDDVAAGRLSPAEAASRLGSDPRQPELRHLVVEGMFREVRVQGDPQVADVAVDGPHRARREGETIHIDAREDDGQHPFRFSRARGRWGPSWGGGGPSRGRGGPSWGGGSDAELVIRVRPDVDVRVELTAGLLVVGGLDGRLDVDIAAGTARLREIPGPLDVRVGTGSIKLATTLRQGVSRVRCGAGTADIELQPGSDVRVRARTHVGRISGMGGNSGMGGRDFDSAEASLTGAQREMNIGPGTAQLDVDVDLGTVHFHLPR
jgi:hypothetical protein